ncbi:hypothetical protein B0H14DRAFT_2943688 [Mycena olivaceomarginata]|nr:hypothetical protein B0H14DRAFT_2943688 [Mycena olivaceomarginata]
MECLTLPCPTLPNQGVNLGSSMAGRDTELIEDAPAYYASRLQWSGLEIGSFWKAFAGAKKDFSAIAIRMGKPASECIEFYYLNKPHRPLGLAEPSNSNLPESDDPISNNRAASIDIDGSVWFRSSNDYSPPSIRWSKTRPGDVSPHRQSISRCFGQVWGLGFLWEAMFFLAFKRIAAQMPHMTTAQVLEFYYWKKNPTRFDDAYLIYDADLHSHRASVLTTPPKRGFDVPRHLFDPWN